MCGISVLANSLTCLSKSNAAQSIIFGVMRQMFVAKIARNDKYYMAFLAFRLQGNVYKHYIKNEARYNLFMI